jgi:hypothetical protein
LLRAGRDHPFDVGVVENPQEEECLSHEGMEKTLSNPPDRPETIAYRISISIPSTLWVEVGSARCGVVPGVSV